MRIRRTSGSYVVGACCALGLVACTASPTDPVARGTVVATARASRIAITNGTDAPVFTAMIGARALPASNLATCADPARCSPLMPGASIQVAYPPAYGGTPEQEAIVLWWHGVQNSDGTFRPDSVRGIRVGL